MLVSKKTVYVGADIVTMSEKAPKAAVKAEKAPKAASKAAAEPKAKKTTKATK